MAASKRLLLVLVSLLLGVLVGSIAWGASERTHADPAASGITPKQAAAVIDKLIASQAAGKDVSAAAALYTRDAVMWQDGKKYSGTAKIRKHMAQLQLAGYSEKRVAPVIVNGDFATTYAQVKAGPYTFLGLGVYQIRGGKIARSWEFALGPGGGGTQPFTNAL